MPKFQMGKPKFTPHLSDPVTNGTSERVGLLPMHQALEVLTTASEELPEGCKNL